MYSVFNLPMHVFNLPPSKGSRLLHWNLFLLVEITRRSKSPCRTAESLKWGHTMTFAWHFCFGVCSCFPRCPECLLLSSLVIQIQQVLQSSGQIPSWWVQISPVSKPSRPYCRCHTICALSAAEFSVYKPLALHCLTCLPSLKTDLLPCLLLCSDPHSVSCNITTQQEIKYAYWMPSFARTYTCWRSSVISAG